MLRWTIWCVALAGCKKPAEAPPPAPTDLLIVSPGAPPLRAMRYAAAKGTKTTIEVSTITHLVAGEMTGASPELVFGVEVVVADVLPDGSMKLATTLADVATRTPNDQPGTAHALEQGAALQGLAITATLAPDGRFSDVHAELGDRKLSEIERAELDAIIHGFDQLAMPLPTAPVGIGAKWRSARKIAADALQLTATTTVDITGIAGERVTYALTSEIHGADQVVTENGTAIDVKNVTGTGGGGGTLELDKLAVAGTLSTELHATMTAQGSATVMTMTTEVKTSPR